MDGDQGDLTPFSISVSDEQLKVLKAKLEGAIIARDTDGKGGECGVPPDKISQLVRYWINGFDWRAKENELNRFPQYRRKIQVSGGFEPLDVHFVYQKSNVAGAIPLIFVHGWPGLYLEGTKVLEMLTSKDGSGPAFDVVVPSLPNFGFSSAVQKKGFGIKKYAEVCHKLMISLGYDEYVTHGGDWGYFITRMMGRLYPSHCKASHVTSAPFGPPSFRQNPLLYLQDLVTTKSAADLRALEKAKEYNETQLGYLTLQCSKPLSLGYALADSPVALLGWIVEKLYTWSDNYPWTDEELITWISIYWFSTAGPEANVRIYYEFAHDPDPDVETVRTGRVSTVKYAVAHFPGEIIRCPKLWSHQMGNVIHQSDGDTGGHFPGWENPQFLANDLKTIFRKGGVAYGAVRGRTGY